jgi:hypothetical protein
VENGNLLSFKCRRRNTSPSSARKIWKCKLTTCFTGINNWSSLGNLMSLGVVKQAMFPVSSCCSIRDMSWSAYSLYLSKQNLGTPLYLCRLAFSTYDKCIGCG